MKPSLGLIQKTYLAQDFTIVEGVDNSDVTNFFKGEHTAPSSKKRANNLYLSRLSGYSTSVMDSGQKWGPGGEGIREDGDQGMGKYLQIQLRVPIDFEK